MRTWRWRPESIRSPFPRAEAAEAVDHLPGRSAYQDVDVAIVCESTYPYLTGGLSAVVHQICEANPGLSIGIIHITWDSHAPSTDLYGIPPQVAWIMPVYQSIEEHRDDFKALTLRASGLGRSDRGRMVTRIFDAIDEHLAGDDDALWRLYDDGINPRTRRFRLWPLLSSLEFMDRFVDRFGHSGLSFAELFWQAREFFSLAFAVTDAQFPKANVYHSHTTGAAALLAAAAARQNGTRCLLTEHNLYVRDTVNHLLGRSMDTAVTLDEWTTLTDYSEAGLLAAPASVTPVQRAWMAWFTRLGVIAYRAADLITYLYPSAVDEAHALGGLPFKSAIVPNGVSPHEFESASSTFDGRLDARDDDAPIWKLAFAGRLVPIKGLLDLLNAMALLLHSGVENWELDVMGPDGEAPEYAELCRRTAEELGLLGRVRFLGSVNLRERLGHYDALLIPSHNEGQPIVVLEAMAVGLPVVGTYVGGMQQLVQEEIAVGTADDAVLRLGACGILVESRQPERFARAIETLLSSPTLFTQLSENGRARVEHYFHLDTAMAMYGDLYARLAGGASTSDLVRTGGTKRVGAPARALSSPTRALRVEGGGDRSAA